MLSVWVSISLSCSAWGDAAQSTLWSTRDIIWRSRSSLDSCTVVSISSVSSLVLLPHWNCFLIKLYFHAELSIIFPVMLYREHEAGWSILQTQPFISKKDEAGKSQWDGAKGGGLGAWWQTALGVTVSGWTVGCSLGKQFVFIIMHLKEKGMLHRLVEKNETHRWLPRFTGPLNWKPLAPFGP